MSRWAALFRSLCPDTADTIDGIRPVSAVGGGSVGCVRCVSPERAEGQARLAFLIAAAQDAVQALGEPDPGLDHERAEIAAALASEAAGDFGPPAAAGQHRKALGGLLRGFMGGDRT